MSTPAPIDIPEGAKTVLTSIFGLGIGTVILLVGLVFFGIIKSDNSSYDYAVQNNPKTVATITKVTYENTKKGGTESHSRYEVKTLSYTVDGKRYSIVDRDPTNLTKQKAKVGTEVNVYYEKSNPGKAIVEDTRSARKDAQLFPIIALAFGSAITLLSGLTLFRNRRFLKRPNA